MAGLDPGMAAIDSAMAVDLASPNRTAYEPKANANAAGLFAGIAGSGVSGSARRRDPNQSRAVWRMDRKTAATLFVTVLGMSAAGRIKKGARAPNQAQ